MKRFFLFSLLAISLTNTAHAQSLEQQAKQIIESKGYWCGKVRNIAPTLFGQTANKSTYHIFCEYDGEVANYEMDEMAAM